MKWRSVISLVVLVLLAACQKADPPSPLLPPSGGGTTPAPSPTPETPPSGDYYLPLLQTTDLHGYITYTDNAVHYRLAYIADKADDLRGADRSRLLLVDGGDLYQGASVSNLLDGWPVYVSLDRMGYDAVALGNHEFDWGIENMIEEDATLPAYEWQGQHYPGNVPVVCANLYRDGQRTSLTKDYVIVEKSAVNTSGQVAPVKIGIIGFAINYAGSIMASQFTEKGYSIRADYALAGRLAQELESSGACDATVMLVHGDAADVAPQLGQGSVIDLVLGGHSHATRVGTTNWGLPYLQGGRHGEHYASGRLVFNVDASGKATFRSVDRLTSVTVEDTRTLARFSSELSADIVAVSDEALSRTADVQQEVLGFIKVGATTYALGGSGGRSSAMGNWMCDILRRAGSADIAFVNSGGIRAWFTLDGQSGRSITAANVHEMFPFDNKVYVYKLTYADLLKVFEYALTQGGQALFSCEVGIDCYYSGSRVRKLEKDGVVLYENGQWQADWASRPVTLVASEYLATTVRTDYSTGTPNPLVAWNNTSRLVSSTQTECEAALQVLRKEATVSGGLLYIDLHPYFHQE